MITRYLEQYAFSAEYGRQMRFIAGPRQTGKTTLARKQLGLTGSERFYYSWDSRAQRTRYRTDPGFLEADLLQYDQKSKRSWVCFDEIHKVPKWKNMLKDIFDGLENRARFIITGSARLDLFRKSGDSLAGRYFIFRLLPLSLGEINGAKIQDLLPESAISDWINKRIQSRRSAAEPLDQLLAFSGFPEPFTKASKRFQLRWQTDYLDRIMQEDIRDLTKVEHLENIRNLMSVLPQRIGRPLSYNALREDLEVAHATVKNYFKAIEMAYLGFTLSPYTTKLLHSVKKEPKFYFYDWTLIPDEGIRFENYIAVELKNLVELWNGYGSGRYALQYFRTRDGKESDFLITNEQKPCLLLEVKLHDEDISAHHLTQARMLGSIPFVQIVKPSGIVKVVDKQVYVVSADRLFA